MAKVKQIKSMQERLEEAIVPKEQAPFAIPENWCWVRIGYLSNLYTGNSINEKIKADKYTGIEEGRTYISTKDISFDSVIDYNTGVKIPYDEKKFKVAPSQSVLLCIEGGSAGRKIGFLQQEVCFVNKLCCFNFYEYVSGLYGYYFLQSSEFYKMFQDRKVGLIGGVSVNNLKEIPFPIAPIAEQKRIVDKIESLFLRLDEAKELIQKSLNEFEDRKSAILHKAFNGELTSKWRARNNLIKNNEKKPFNEFCQVVRGGSPRPAGSELYYNGTIPFMKVGDITNSRSPYIVKCSSSIKEAGLSKTRIVPENTLLLTNSGATLGVPGITTFTTAFNDGIAAFIGIDPKSIKYFYYFWLSKTQSLRALNIGAAQPNLNTNIIGRVQVIIPTIREQQEIVRILDNFFEKEDKSKELLDMIDQIEEIKKSILARAFRGELGTHSETDEPAIELLKKII